MNINSNNQKKVFMVDRILSDKFDKSLMSSIHIERNASEKCI